MGTACRTGSGHPIVQASVAAAIEGPRLGSPAPQYRPGAASMRRARTTLGTARRGCLSARLLPPRPAAREGGTAAADCRGGLPRRVRRPRAPRISSWTCGRTRAGWCAAPWTSPACSWTPPATTPPPSSPSPVGAGRAPCASLAPVLDGPEVSGTLKPLNPRRLLPRPLLLLCSLETQDFRAHTVRASVCAAHCRERDWCAKRCCAIGRLQARKGAVQLRDVPGPQITLSAAGIQAFLSACCCCRARTARRKPEAASGFFYACRRITIFLFLCIPGLLALPVGIQDPSRIPVIYRGSRGK